MKKMADVENVVCSAETKVRHPELYHYTGEAGFDGIVRTQTLWCSHYRDMADTTEVQLMRDLLVPPVAKQMNAIAACFNRHNRRLWEASGRGEKVAGDLVKALYNSTFDGKGHYSTLEAYLFSFSTYAGDTDFDREHGIRSQWDRYGKNGFCFVFDIGEMANLLKQEGDTRYWAWLKLDPVRYADQPVESLFPKLVQLSADTLRQFLGGVKYPEMAIQEFLEGAALLKATDYKFEREVRIIGIPGTAKMARQAAREFESFDASMPLPDLRKRADGRRYIAMSEGLDRQLPIKRIIIGPGADQDQRAAHARSMLGNHIPITISRVSIE